MISGSSNRRCVKCGHVLPPDAGFCPHCGTAAHDVTFVPASEHGPATFLPDSSPRAVTPLPIPQMPPIDAAGNPTIPGAQPPGATDAPTIKQTVALPSSVGQAVTISPTGIQTSLDTAASRSGLRPAVAFLAGQQIGPRYTILKLLGTGGMGAVYQAFDHELGVAVAIKVIRPAATPDQTAAKELEIRFKRELVLARQVTHKHVVRIHDLGEIDGTKYLTMPFVDGETLAQALAQSGAFPVSRVIKIAQQVAQGLAAAHEKGVVHRDLKPENIMIERASDEPLPNGGDALIMDFGIARSVDAGSTQTAAGSVIGTLEYMAPEQAQGKKVDQRADQYAFGLIVYDMLIGRQRLVGGEGPMAELLNRIAAPPPAPRTVKPEIPEALNDIVMRCLQPAVDARYPTTMDLVQALDHLTPDGHIRTDVHEVIVTRQRPAWQLAAAAALIVAVAGTAGWIISNRTTERADLPRASELRDPETVLVANFENKTGDPVFDGVVEQAIGLGVEGSSFITAYPRREALRIASTIKQGATLDEATAKLVALREGINTVIVGSIVPDGSGYQINVRGLGPGADATVRYTLEEDAPSKGEVLATVGALAHKVRTALGDTATPNATDTFTAANLEAASAFVQAQELQAQGRREEAIKKYEEAIALDKDFGRAYSGMAIQYEALGRPAEAEKYYQEAMSRIERMSDREKYMTRGAYYGFMRKPELSVQEFESLLKIYPYDGAALSNLTLARFYMRDFDQVLENARKVVALRPNNVGRRTNLSLYAMYAGEYEDAIAASDEARKLNPGAFKAFVARGLSELALGRAADAVKTYEALTPVSADGATFAAAGLADVAMVEGRFADAIAILDKAIGEDEARKNLVRAAEKRIARGEAHLARGDTAAAVRDGHAAAAHNDHKVRSAAGLLLARAGRRDEALKIAESLEGRLEPDSQAYGKLIRAEAALLQGQGRAAIDLAREAEKLADTWLGHLVMARAYIMLDAFTEADSQLDITFKRQGEAMAMFLDDVPSYRYFPPVHYYKGRVQEGLKSTGAGASYKTFLAFSKTGEGQLAADARARLAKLGS